jgi:hypothetical protein
MRVGVGRRGMNCKNSNMLLATLSFDWAVVRKDTRIQQSPAHCSNKRKSGASRAAGARLRAGRRAMRTCGPRVGHTFEL